MLRVAGEAVLSTEFLIAPQEPHVCLLHSVVVVAFDGPVSQLRSLASCSVSNVLLDKETQSNLRGIFKKKSQPSFAAQFEPCMAGLLE
jgi:hypothetical protein